MGRYSFLHDDDHDQDDDGDDHGHDDDDHDNNDRKLDSVNNDPMAVDHHADYADDADADYADESYDQQYHHQRHQKQHHHQQHNNQQQHEEDYEYHRWRRCQERGGGGGHDHGHGHEEERYQRRRRQQYGEQQQTDMNGRNWQIVELRRRPNGHGVHGGHDPYPPQDDTGVVSEDDDDENNDEPEEGEILEYNDRQRRRRSMSSSRRRRRGGGGWGNDVVIGGGDIHYHIHIDGREVLRRRRTSPSTNGNDGDDQHHFNDLQPVLVAGGGRIHRNNTFNGDMVGSALDEPNDGHHHHHRPRYYSHSWQSICHTLLAVVAVTTHICYWYGDRQHHTHTSSSSSSSSSQFLLPTSWSYQNLWPSTTSLSVWKLFELTKSTPNFFHQQYTSNSGEPYWVFPSQWNLLDVQTNDDDDDDQHDQTISSKKIAIFGQDLALQIAQDRLNNNQEEDQTAVVSQTNTILYLTGGGGTSSVGKTLLVYKLLEQITLSLPPPSLVRWRLPWWWSSSSSSSSSWDYSSLKDKNAFDICQNEWNHQIVSTSTQNDNDEQNDDLPSLCPLIRMSPSDAKARDLNLIGNQLRTKYSSMILLMERVDEWNDSELMETLNKILDANHDQHTTSSRRRLVVVMTSNVGSNAQEKWIRKYLQQNVQQHHRSSTNSVADGSDIDSTTSAEPLSSSSLPSTTSISRSVVNKELIPLLKQVIQEFHGVSMMIGLTIIPFNVLDRNAIRSILLDYINISSTFLPFSFQVTASGLDRLLDDHLEWHQWIHKSSGQILRKWSPSGASQVTELWNSHMAVSLLQQYQRQSGSDTNSGCIARAESTGGVTDNGTKALTTILDVDEGSTDRFALRSCYLMATNDGDSPNNVDEEKPFIKSTSKISDNNTCHGRTIHVIATKTRNKSIARTGDSRYRENEDEEEEMYCCPVDRLPCRFYL